MENKRKCEKWCWGQMVEYLEESVFIQDFIADTFNVIKWQLDNEKTKHESRDVHLGQIHYILMFHTTPKCTKNCDIETLSTMFIPPIECKSKL
jgi:hypothetical protein